jgi:hypothetical protein
MAALLAGNGRACSDQWSKARLGTHHEEIQEGRARRGGGAEPGARCPQFPERSRGLSMSVRLNVIHRLLSLIPHEQAPSKPVKLPTRRAAPAHPKVDYPIMLVPDLPWGG